MPGLEKKIDVCRKRLLKPLFSFPERVNIFVDDSAVFERFLKTVTIADCCFEQADGSCAAWMVNRIREMLQVG
jgi:hypothetical protein